MSNPRTLFLLTIFCLGLSAGNLCATDQSPPNDSTTKLEGDFQLPERNPTSEKKASSTFDLKAMLGETGIKIAIVVGILLIAVLLLSKQKTTRTIPGEAIEILGTVPFTAKQNIQLIRFGQKLVLIESSVNGLKPISEITDPAEVNQMLDLIRPRTR